MNAPAAAALTREQCQANDAADPLAGLRAQFSLPQGVVYLDGNSLGAQARSVPARVAEVVQHEWGEGLIRSWNDAAWISLPQRVGDKIARLVGAAPGELLVADSTSINLYKVLSAALGLAQVDAPMRRVILTERGNFPTDLYIAQSIAAQHGCTLELCAADELAGRLDERVAVLLLTQVNYRSGRLHNLHELTRQAHAAGALTVWDLAHSAGALPVDLNGAEADFAVGCGYKFLNGGPGAPAFVWAHARHVERAHQPLVGWLGHARPFEFSSSYRPAAGISRFLCGTPPIVALAALECGVDTVLAAEPLGGLPALREKSLALSELFLALCQMKLVAHGLSLESPLDGARRGSQVSLGCARLPPGAGQAVMQALIARGVIGDFRAGNAAAGEVDLLRFGFTPLYTRYTDVHDAVTALEAVMANGEWCQSRFEKVNAVT